MSIDEVCRRLGVTRTFAYRLLKDGRLVLEEAGQKGRKGRGVKIKEASVQAYEEERLVVAEGRMRELCSLAKRG